MSCRAGQPQRAGACGIPWMLASCTGVGCPQGHSLQRRRARSQSPRSCSRSASLTSVAAPPSRAARSYMRLLSGAPMSRARRRTRRRRGALQRPPAFIVIRALGRSIGLPARSALPRRWPSRRMCRPATAPVQPWSATKARARRQASLRCQRLRPPPKNGAQLRRQRHRVRHTPPPPRRSPHRRGASQAGKAPKPKKPAASSASNAELPGERMRAQRRCGGGRPGGCSRGRGTAKRAFADARLHHAKREGHLTAPPCLAFVRSGSQT